MTAKPTLTISLPVLGRETSNIGEYTLDSHYLVSTDAFDVNLVSEYRYELFDLELQPIELSISGQYVSGALQMIGRIDKSVSGEGRAINLTGRDFIADLVTGRVDPAYKVNKDTDLGTAILEVCQPYGITQVDATGDLTARNLRTGKTPGGGGAGKDFQQVRLEDVKPKPGQGVYDFCNRLSARNGATIQPGATRGVLSLQAPDYDQSPLYQLRRTLTQPQGQPNNINAAKAVRDFSNLPTYALLEGQSSGATSGSRPSGTMDIVAMADTFGAEFSRIVLASCASGRIKAGTAGPSDGKLYRLFYQKDDDSKNQDQATALTRRSVSELMKDCLVYTVTLKGFEDPESHAIWAINTIVDVADELNNVFEPLWIVSRKFRYSRQGPVTELECWRKGVFVVGE
jgi:prophage tail gpP-like protein